MEQQCLAPACAVAARVVHPRARGAICRVSLYLPPGSRIEVLSRLFGQTPLEGPAVVAGGAH
eukprot:4816257-Lingulodinium_polyedra.AAC.1